ncbi:MAG: hypothetical protein DRG83_17760 [Deltaproteobacteria bacterium]|nr:MAG: hypothetical protein DRG83_17760 [Deltaproteobacteria bacterium]
MAKNFTINARHYNGSISLDLNGDFDAISAFELLNFIKDQCLNCSQVFVNTEGLKKIFYFGVEIWEKHLWMIERLNDRITFQGPNAQFFSTEKENTTQEKGFANNSRNRLLGLTNSVDF